MSGRPEGQSGAGDERQPKEKAPRGAWQPLTPKGIAAFAGAPLRRLFLVQWVVALLAAGAVVWFLQRAWFPVVTQAISQLPEQGRIASGRLDWEGDSPKLLAENRFLALAVDLRHEGQARSPAHLEIEFGRNDFKLFSLFGFVAWPYAHDELVAFNRTDLGPWWGAWAPALLALAAGLTLGSLLVIWAILATVYCLPTWLLAWYANRDLALAGSWRLAGAGLLPGALLMVLAILGYGFRAFDVVHLLSVFAVHFIVGWLYIVLATLRLARHPAAAGATNPFTSSQARK